MYNQRKRLAVLLALVFVTSAVLVMVLRLTPPPEAPIAYDPARESVHSAGMGPGGEGIGGGAPVVDPSEQFDDIDEPTGYAVPAALMPRVPHIELQRHAVPTLYIVLDDAGHHLDHLRRFNAFPGRLTVAVLPHLRATTASARMAVALGHEVILHLPMEPSGTANPGPGAVLVRDGDDVVRARLDAALRAVPGAVGMNNHMGSRATTDERVMRALILEAQRRGLYFLDSRTSAQSIAPAVALAQGAVPLQRDVFLDNVRTEEAINAQLELGLSIAREKGYAVLIGHVTSPELARVLARRYGEIRTAGFEFGVVSELVSHHRYVDTRD